MRDERLPIPVLPEARLPVESRVAAMASWVGALLDTLALRAGQVVIDATVMPRPGDSAALLDSGAPLVDPSLLREPGRFFDFAASPPVPRFPRVLSARGLRGGEARMLEFEAPYRPYVDVGDGRNPPRDGLRVEHWTHHDGRRRGTLIALHGFLMGQPLVDALALYASHWYRLGLDVALPILPHHGPRSEGWISGERFAVPHVARLGDAVRRAVFELRLLLTWLRRDAGPVGMLGLSLGAYLTALLAELYEDLDFVVPISPPACIGDLAWRFFARSRHYRRGLPPELSREALRNAYRVHSPLAHPLRVPPERVLIVARRGDHVVPPAHPYALWLHWGRPAIRWLSGGHLAPFDRPRIVAAVERHLRDLHVL